MKVLLIFRFETGDASCKYWDESAIVEGIGRGELKEFCDYLEDSIISYCDAGLDDDTEYSDIVADNLGATGYKWSFIGGNQICCDEYYIFDL